MAVKVVPEMVEPVTRALLGAIDVDGGPTDEQSAVLRAVVSHLWQRPDLELGALTPLSPEETATVVTDPEARRRFKELMVTLELCRHPESPAQIARVEEYAGALDEMDESMVIARRWVDEGCARATEDFDRFYAERLPELSEPTLRDDYLRIEEADLELARRLEALHDLARRHPRARVHRVLPPQSDHRAGRRHPHTRALRESRHEPRDRGIRADRSRRDRARRVHARDERQRRQLDPVHRQPRDPRGRDHPARRDHAEERTRWRVRARPT